MNRYLRVMACCACWPWRSVALPFGEDHPLAGQADAVTPMVGGVATVGRMSRDDEGLSSPVPVREVGAPGWATGGDGLFGPFSIDLP